MPLGDAPSGPASSHARVAENDASMLRDSVLDLYFAAFFGDSPGLWEEQEMNRSGNALGTVIRLCLACCLLGLPAAPACARDDPSWQFAAVRKTMFASHTSYEFGNPFPPNQEPLSRLEFPVNSVWGGGAARMSLSRFSAGVEFLTSLADQESAGFKDSDWADDEMPDFLTNLGLSSCRLEPSYQVRADVDAGVADLVSLPEGFDLRPLMGFQWQRFSLVPHDGIQYNYEAPGKEPDVIPLPGDAIDFEQNWYRYFLGMRFGYEWRRPVQIHRLRLQAGLEWSYVYGENRDHHLLREGTRITEEKTVGDAWRASLGVLVGIAENLDLSVEADYLNVRSSGTHTLQNDDFELFLSWSNGVRVWSEQYGVSVRLGYRL